MKCLFAVFALALARSCTGATDDHYVEQVHSPFVSAIDPGTHMTSSGLHGRDIQGIPGDFAPYSSSSQHEFHEEQRFVNGQPIYEKRHERRYQDGRLVHEDGHEKGHSELGTTHLIGASGTGGYGSAGGSYRTSSRQYQSSSGGSFDSAGNSLLPGVGHGGGLRTRHGEAGRAVGSSGGRLESDSSSASRSVSSSTNSHSRIGGEFEGGFRSDVDRLRQQLHQGTSVIRTPVTGSSVHEEKREEAHFVDGQQVYRRNEERKYKDGRLVHDVSEEKGPDDLGTRINTRPVGNTLASNSRRGYESSSSQDQLSSSADNYNPQSQTSYRASYWRPGSQARTVSTNSQRQTNQVSTSYQPSASRITYTNTDTGPYQGSYRTTSNRIRTEGNKPAYRASYTPSRSVERVPQLPVAIVPVPSSQVSSSSSRREYSSSSGYRSSTTRPITSQSRSETSEYQTSYSNEPDISYRRAQSSDISQERNSAAAAVAAAATAAAAAAAAPSYQPAPHQTYPQQPSAPITSTATRRQFSTAYGSGSYVRPTESPITSQTTSRITDTYSEPYSVRSSSYQPSSFANYSAWSHWNEGSGQPSHIISSENTRESNYRTSAISNQIDDSSYHSNTNIGNPSSATTSRQPQQSQHVRTFRPGFLYDENEIDDQQSHSGYAGSESIRSQSSLDNEYSAGYPSGSYSSDSEQSSSSRTSSSNTPRTTDASIRAGSGSQVNLAFVVDVGEGDSMRLTGKSQSVEHQDERYDISPHVDGAISSHVDENEVETEYGGSSRSSSINSLSRTSTINSEHNDDSDFNRNRGQAYGQSDYESGRRYESSGSGYRSSAVIPVSGSSFDRTTKVTNRTTNTMTSHIQPLVSSYKLETRTSRRYLNGQLVSETKFNRYYENGILVHENQTERSRDEMVTDGIDVTSFDLTTEDLARYGMLQSGSQPTAHSQRFEMRQEKEFVDGDQVYEATHERHYQDGELIHEDHNERDHDELVALGRTRDTGIGTYAGITGQVTGGGAYTSNFVENRNYGNSFETGTYDGLPRVGTRQSSGVGETVTVSVSPRTRTRKTEVRQEQEFRDGQQVFDLRHERRFDDGQLVHEDLSEKGPSELGAVDHTDALADIISGRTLATASQTGYRPSPAAVAAASRQSQASRQQNYQENSYYIDDSENFLNRGNEDREYVRSQNRAFDAGHEVVQSSYQGATVEAGGSQRPTGLVGTNLLTSGCLTCVIGSSGAQQFDSLSNAQSLSTGNSASSAQTITSNVDVSNANLLTRSGGGYYTMMGNSGSGQGSGRSSSSGYSSETSSQNLGTSGVDTYGSNSGGLSGYEAAGNFEAYSGGAGEGQAAVTHRREMEVEEHYENGQLVRGREDDKEWSNNQLIKHDNRNYGQGGARSGSSYSGQTSPTLSSSSSFDTYGDTNGQELASFGASATFGAERSASYGGGATLIGGVSDVGQGGVTHRREMEVEEHYENGILVRGREEDKEWKNEQLLRHDHRRYGEGDEEGRPRASALSSSSASHSSTGSSSVFPHSEVGECSALPCRNGGSCIVGMKGYLCVCTFGFRGSVCEEAYCPTRYCRHDGICQVAGDGSHSCSCPISHTGPRCEHRVRNRGVN